MPRRTYNEEAKGRRRFACRKSAAPEERKKNERSGRERETGKGEKACARRIGPAPKCRNLSNRTRVLLREEEEAGGGFRRGFMIFMRCYKAMVRFFVEAKNIEARAERVGCYFFFHPPHAYWGNLIDFWSRSA